MERLKENMVLKGMNNVHSVSRRRSLPCNPTIH